MKACQFWADTGDGDFDLLYVRDKEKNELDFLITRCTATAAPGSRSKRSWRYGSGERLHEISAFAATSHRQIIQRAGTWRWHENDWEKVLVELVDSAEEVLASFV